MACQDHRVRPEILDGLEHKGLQVTEAGMDLWVIMDTLDGVDLPDQLVK